MRGGVPGLGVLEKFGDMYLEDRREAGGSVDGMTYLDRCDREDAVGRTPSGEYVTEGTCMEDERKLIENSKLQQ